MHASAWACWRSRSTAVHAAEEVTLRKDYELSSRLARLDLQVMQEEAERSKEIAYELECIRAELAEECRLRQDLHLKS